jgi:hypothetical protein
MSKLAPTPAEPASHIDHIMDFILSVIHRVRQSFWATTLVVAVIATPLVGVLTLLLAGPEWLVWGGLMYFVPVIGLFLGLWVAMARERAHQEPPQNSD